MEIPDLQIDKAVGRSISLATSLGLFVFAVFFEIR